MPPFGGGLPCAAAYRSPRRDGSPFLMTAAFGHLLGPALRVRACVRLKGVSSVLALILPVPLFAALGLSLPLPATVERIAARLVPFGNVAALESDASRTASGSIVLTSGKSEQTVGSAGPGAAPGARPGQPRSVAEPSLPAAGPRTQPGVRPTDNAGDLAAPAAGQPSATGLASSAPAPAGDGGSATPPAGSNPDPDPVSPSSPTIVDTATTVAADAVAQVTTTVSPATSAVTTAVGIVPPP